MVADSGAVDHLIHKKELPCISLEATDASRNGLCYTNANGGRILNYGKKEQQGTQGVRAKRDIQVADVKQGVASKPRMVEEGNDVLLSKKGSHIKKNPTGTITPMREGNGVFELAVVGGETRKLQTEDAGS